MKIVAPVSKVYEAEDIIRAGADEIYCGVYTKEWRSVYSDMSSPNRRPGRGANLDDFKQLNSLVRLAHSFGITVSFAINEFYSEGQYASVFSDIRQAVDAGVDALIVTDINVLQMVNGQHWDVQIHIGTGGTVFNSHAVAFYKGMGASRIILDRQLSLEEIRAIASNSAGIELAAFISNQKCHNIDGFCTFQHGITPTKYPLLSSIWNMKWIKKVFSLYPWDTSLMEKAILDKELACCLTYEVYSEKTQLDLAGKKEIMHRLYDGSFLNRCGACALYDLEKSGIGFVKIVGREDLTGKKIRDIEFIHRSLALLEENLSRRDFMEKAKVLYRKMHSRGCKETLCYYQV